MVVIYLTVIVIDFIRYLLGNMGDFTKSISSGFGSILSVFSVLVIAFVIAYLLNPLVDFLQKKYDTFYASKLGPFLEKRFKQFSGRKVKEEKKRFAGSLMAYLLIFILLGALGTFFVKRIGGGTNGDFVLNINENIAATVNSLQNLYTDVQIKLTELGVMDYVTDKIADFVESVGLFITDISKNIPGTLSSAGSVIMNFIMALVVAFYFLRDKDMIKRKLKELAELILPDKIERSVFKALNEIHAVFSGYIIGQLTDAAIMATLLSVTFSVIGLNFSLLIGLIAGLSNIIPYFGAIVGFVLSVSVALLSGEPLMALYCAIAVIVLQQIDGMFIVPRIVGKRVKLSPVLVLLSLAAAANLFGIGGLIFAVPVCAIIKIFATRFFDRMKAAKEKETSKDSD